MIVIKVNYTSVAPVIKITYDETPVYIKTSVNNVYAKVVYGTGQGGGSYTNKYYGAFSDFTNQTASVINTGYAMTYNTTDLSYGVRIVDNSKITFDYSGIYNLQFSAQFRSIVTNGENDINIWLKKNGVDVTGSNGFVAVPRKTATVDGHSLPSWNYLLSINTGDYYQLYWSTTNVNVSIQTYSANYHPSTASIILTATQI
jgi:hypothetical protein